MRTPPLPGKETHLCPALSYFDCFTELFYRKEPEKAGPVAPGPAVK
jgi:hypothetical protein